MAATTVPFPIVEAATSNGSSSSSSSTGGLSNSNSFWNSRPTALSSSVPDHFAFLSREALINYYNQDCERACREGVNIFKNTNNKNNNKQTTIRCLQWNINGWAGSNGRYQNMNKTMAGIIQTILDADADVILLNEYDHGYRGIEHEQLEQALREHGYYFMFDAKTVSCPSAIATRLYVHDYREVQLSVERSALILKLNVDGEMVSVIGTHLDFMDGNQRRKEMQVLIQDLLHHQNNGENTPEQDGVDEDIHERMIIMGDLNQQRQRDYEPEVWSKITKSMDRRNTCHDDGVDSLLQKENFACVWDMPSAQRNWKTSYPPSTHWTGTIVDYAYGRNLQAESVCISPVGFSDHRMIVCGWRLS